MAPVDSAGYLLIAQGNLNTACVASVQAAQMNQKFNTLSGLGDLMYTVLNYPIEGFFQAQTDPTINNQIWTAVLSLYQGWNQPKLYDPNLGGANANLANVMTCNDVGFHFGRIYQALLQFDLPD